MEWRWARDFEQTRVCVSEAPPPPRLLGAEGARREKEAAAPPALWCLLRVCPFSSRSPPAKCHNVPEVHGVGSGPALSLAKQRCLLSYMMRDAGGAG